MGNFTNLSAAIVKVLQGVNQNGSPAFADIEAFPTVQFSGTPAVTVVPSDNESDYSTVSQNFRTYVFFVDIYYPLETQGETAANAYAIMQTLIDTTLDAFDMSSTLSGACQILRPSPSSWSLVQTNFGECLSARINLLCGLLVQTNNG